MSLYLDGPVPWLFDPESDELVAIARDAEARTPDMRCGDIDWSMLERVIRERHFGVATGLAELPPIEPRDVRTWGELTELQSELREVLCDNHVYFYGTRTEQRNMTGPAVERRDVDGVRVVHIRRLFGTPEDDRVLAAWAADADSDFEHDRIVVDLRSNSGGNDGFTYEWAARRFRSVERFGSDSTWSIGGVRLGEWNRAVWQHALHGTRVPEPPRGELEIVDESYDLEEGDRPWGGRMLVLVDRLTRSSGESSAWFLRQGLGARLLGEPTFGMIEYGNIVPYALPGGLAVGLPTKHNDFGFRVERVGFPVDEPLEPGVPVEDVARRFDSIV